MKLNTNIVRIANAIFYQRHPEMRGKAIDDVADTDKKAAYIREWWAIYREVERRWRERGRQGQVSTTPMKQRSNNTLKWGLIGLLVYLLWRGKL